VQQWSTSIDDCEKNCINDTLDASWDIQV
jgi:hypothetical protein